MYTAPPGEKPDYLLSLSIDGAGLSPFNQRTVESPQTRIAPTLSHQFIPFIVHNTIKRSMCVCVCVHVWKNIHDKCVRGYLKKGVVIEMLKGRCHSGANSAWGKGWK
jgi:hypothetical protein